MRGTTAALVFRTIDVERDGARVTDFAGGRPVGDGVQADFEPA